jgi:effector-binding domain-containing protein
MKTPEETPSIAVKSIDDVFVAYIRFVGQNSEIPTYFKRLREQVGKHINGDPICLYDVTANENPQENHIEVCYPVDPLIDDNVATKILLGCKVVCITWTGPAGSPWGRAEWWRGLRPYVRDNYITLDEDPIREIRHADNGTETIEVQYTLQFPRWLQGLKVGLCQYAGEEVQQQVMEGSDHLQVDSPIQERLTWICEALERLDQRVNDHQARCCILNGCAHRFPPTRIEKLRAIHQKSHDIDALLEVMRADTSVGGSSWYAHPVREGDIIHNYNDPADPQGYQQAQTKIDQSIAACFCPIGQAAMKAGLALSPTFCNCSAGYTRQLWEGIFQQPVRVEIVESVLRGDARCRFEIHIPPGVLKGVSA